MAYNEESVSSECLRVKRGFTVCSKKLKQVRHMNAMNFSTCKSYQKMSPMAKVIYVTIFLAVCSFGFK